MRLSLQTAFSQQKLHLKGPSEHSGNTQEFTNQFTKLAWLETMLLCGSSRKVFFNLPDPSGAPSSSTEKGNTRKRMSVPSQVDSDSNPGTKGPAALGESHDLSEPTA